MSVTHEQVPNTFSQMPLDFYLTSQPTSSIGCTLNGCDQHSQFILFAICEVTARLFSGHIVSKHTSNKHRATVVTPIA